MPDVVSIYKAGAGAAGKAAANVPTLQGAANGGWNDARLTSNVQWFTVWVFVPVHDGAITTQAPGRFRRNVTTASTASLLD